MDTFRRTFSAVNRSRRTVWRSVKRSCVFSCFVRRRRSTRTSIDDSNESAVSDVACEITETAPTTNVLPLINNPTEAKNEIAVCDVEQGQQWNDIEKDEKQQPAITISDTAGECETVTEIVDVCLPSNKDDQLDRAENLWVQAIVASENTTDADRTSVGADVKDITTEELNKKVRSFLNKIAPKNKDVIIMSFVALPINTVERLENVVDMIFERAIDEKCFTSTYTALCSALEFVQVRRAENTETTSFQLLMMKKCQSLFESDMNNQTESAKKLEEINSCTNPEKKEILQFEYDKYQRRIRYRSVGNYRFVGEMFNQHIIQVDIILHCIAYLISQRTEETLEYLCNLLRIAGKELEQWYDLTNEFDNLKDLTAVKSFSLRTRFMIQDILDLRKNKWTLKLLDCGPVFKGNEEENISEAGGNNKNRRCRDTCSSINIITHDQGDKEGDVRKINCYKCNRSGRIVRDCKDGEKFYRYGSDDRLARDCSKSDSEQSYYNNCHKKGYSARNCPDGRRERGPTDGSSSIICDNSNKLGRFPGDNTVSRNSNGKYSVLCQNCNGSGHMERDCPEL